MDESIEKVEWRTYYPYVKSFRNNDTIEITINQSDVFDTMYDGLLLISGKVTGTGDGNVALVNNAGAFMFSTITYEMNAKEIESVREPGLVSTVRGYVCYTTDDSKHLGVARWNFPNNLSLNKTDGRFNFLIPLKHLFNIFNDYRVVTCGKQSIRLTRSNNDNNCVELKEKTLPNGDQSVTTVSVNIENVELKVKRIYPSNDIRLKLLKVIRGDTPIVIPNSMEFHMKPSLPEGSTRDVWHIKTSSSIESPRYVIVCFQTDSLEKLTGNATFFDNINITNIRLTLNGESFPNERMRLNFAKDDYTEAHYR
ncbi:hypothetical protein NQ315_000612 [Exocentrus adspersus]|uniref:Double jelly roll-like domain-containing protein n=1 Tax=Exocentrus adspersus TaxID=1586481 RepID=A0AAV8VN58_9CUCU|nr:hypothetical protein NQ315_000612 [Exocentrus adspersus]